MTTYCTSGYVVITFTSKVECTYVFVCFVLIWVSLNCRQAIQIRHYLLDWWFRHSPTAEAQPLVSHSSPKLPLYGNLSLHLTQYQQMWSHTDACLHSWKATNPDTPVTGTHCVLDPRLPYLDDATGATSWYSSKFSLRRTGCQWGSSYHTPTIEASLT